MSDENNQKEVDKLLEHLRQAEWFYRDAQYKPPEQQYDYAQKMLKKIQDAITHIEKTWLSDSDEESTSTSDEGSEEG